MKPSTDADEWLDEAGAVSRPRAAKKKILSRAKILSPEEGNGTVTEIFPNQSAVRLDQEARPALCRYRMATLAFGAVHRERSPVCVGDRVRVEAGVIVGRCERRNRLIRPAPNARDPLLHVLAANVDCLVVVAAAREPGFSAGIVDRFLVAASAQKIQPILCVNKSDLIKQDEAREWSHYPAAGVAVVETSAKGGSGLERLMALLQGKAVVFCGHSGVGKTSLLRRLLSDESYGRVGAVSAASDKGRHTTSGAVLLAGPDGSSFIDTPGVMNFGLLDVARGELLAHFPELHAAAAGCAADCAHDEEPACALRALPRYASYREIRRSLAKNG
ncbi:MAG TPA: ribosome small subunit-dependent GTPase A [Elusimicrobiota bacterium]|nr:ribosome small subunit-dependent GTPase A [Elusimicrobiota bacterium]